jgi:hypothetical protein
MDDEKPSPFADLVTGAAWLAVAVAIIIGAWQMDRLVHLQASIYTVPGLVPGILGAAIGLMAIILMLRGLRAGALAGARTAARPSLRLADHGRLIAALILCLGFAVGLIGHGLPFWAGAAIFVALTVLVFQFPERRQQGTLARGAAIAVVFGLITAVAIQFLFQDLFLVRLP